MLVSVAVEGTVVWKMWHGVRYKLRSILFPAAPFVYIVTSHEYVIGSSVLIHTQREIERPRQRQRQSINVMLDSVSLGLPTSPGPTAQK